MTARIIPQMPPKRKIVPVAYSDTDEEDEVPLMSSRQKQRKERFERTLGNIIDTRLTPAEKKELAEMTGIKAKSSAKAKPKSAAKTRAKPKAKPKANPKAKPKAKPKVAKSRGSCAAGSMPVRSHCRKCKKC